MPKLSEEKLQERKDHIVHTAFELFALHGYSQVSVNDIVAAAKISKGGFYTYFSSKQEIFYEILRVADSKKVQLVQSLDQDTTSAGGAEKRLYDYVTGRLKAFNEPENRKWIRFSIEFWSTVQHDRFYEAMNAKRYALYEAQIGGFIQDGIRTGEFRKDIKVEQAAFVVISMIDGIAFSTAVMGQPLTDQRISQAAQMVVDSVRSR